jgi:signal transduction histidine kinase
MQYLLDGILLASLLINIAVATYVLITKWRSNYAIPFFIMCNGIAIWIGANYFFQVTTDLDRAFLYDQFANAGALLLSLGIYFFSRNFPQTSTLKSKPNTLEWIYIFITSIFIILSFIPGPIDQGVVLNADGSKQLVTGSLKLFLYCLVLVGLLGCFINFIHSYFKTKGLYRIQIGIFLVCLAISVSGGVVFNILLPAFGNVTFASLGPAFAVAVAIGSVYCMINYRYTDFRVIFSDLFEKFFLVSFQVLSIILLNGLSLTYFSNSLLSRIILYAASIFLFIQIVNRIKKANLSRALFVPDYEGKLNLFNEIAIKIDNTSGLIEFLKKTIREVVPIKTLEIITDLERIKNNKNLLHLNKIFSQRKSTFIIFEEELKRNIDSGINDHRMLNFIHVIEKDELFKNVDVVFELNYLDNILGYILLGGKKHNQAYTKYDINFLEQISNHFTIYLYKLNLYSEVQNFNSTLQEKIDKATAELQAQKAQLQEKYQFERDMVGIMGHELRTPMTVAKGMTELLYTKVKTSENVEKDYLLDKLDKIYRSIVKESELIQTMLSTSHIDNNKVNLQLTDVNILELIDFSISAFQKDADLKGLKLEFIKPDFEVPKLLNDQNRLQEIVNNLVSNAIKYTNEGSVRIMLEKQGEFLLYSVIDTGIGIPKNEIANIGKKFYRIHQHLDDKKEVVRAGGTGLGLYVVKGLLVAMGGELLIESEEGVGSKFTALIPLEVKENEKVNITNASTNENDMFQRLGLKK